MSIPSEPYILAIDVGTSSLKSVVYDHSGNLLRAAVQHYEYTSPAPGWAEADPDDWWNALQATLRQLRDQMPDFSHIAALALTGQMHTGVLLDAHLNVIKPALLWLDRRAAAETAELQQVFHLPPYHLNSTYTLPKLVWLARHRPDILSRARHILWPKDYLRFRLTGDLRTDTTEAGGAALLDWERMDWAVERLEWAGISPAILPPLCQASDDAGRILPEITRMLGLRPDVKVLVGCGDVLALVTGAPPAEGRVTCSMGSSSMIFGPMPKGKSLRDPLDRIYVYPLLPVCLLGGVSSTSGASLQWAYRTLFDPAQSLETAIASALTVEPGSGDLIFLPFLSGERSPYWSDRLSGSYYGLTLSHTRMHMLRAVMEGVAYSLRAMLDIFTETGFEVKEIALAGGGVTTPGWSEIIANVCQTPVVIYSGQETVTRGLYACACQAMEAKVSFEQALMRTFKQPPQRIAPDPQVASIYNRLYRRYRRLADFANSDLSRLE